MAIEEFWVTLKVATAVAGATALLGALIVPAVGTASQAGGEGRGKTLFQQRCAACHSVAPNARGVGPNLAGVVGRKAGTATYNYSPAMQKAGLVWNAANLDAYLAAPRKVVPGTKMLIGTPAAGDRREIIAYLSATRR